MSRKKQPVVEVQAPAAPVVEEQKQQAAVAGEQAAAVQEAPEGAVGQEPGVVLEGVVVQTTDGDQQGATGQESDGGEAAQAQEPAAPAVEVQEAATTAPEEPAADEPVQVLISTAMALLQQELAEYVENMRPGREVNSNTGMLMQVKLNALIKAVLRQEGEEFIAQMNYLLAAFEEHREGVFSERYVFRFIDSVPLSRGDRTALERLVNLYMVTADVKSRKDALKHVDLAKVAETLQDGKMQERLFQFYSM